MVNPQSAPSPNESWLEDLIGAPPTHTATNPVPITPIATQIAPQVTPTSNYEQDRYERRLLRQLGRPSAPVSDAPLPTLSGHESPSPYLAPELEVLQSQLKEQIRKVKLTERKAERLVKRARAVISPPKPEKHDSAEFGVPVPPPSPDTRTPDPLSALSDGQKLLAKAAEGFPGDGRTPMATEVRALDPRERVFVGNLFNGMMADEAAEKAGYPHRPDFAMRLVAKPHIRQALDWMQQEYLRSIGATLTNAVTQMTHIAFLDPRKVVNMETGAPIPLHKLDAATAAALEAVEITETEFNGVSKVTKTKYKFNSKLKALQQLGEHLGLFNQVVKVEHTGANGGPIQMEMSQTEIARRMLFVLRQQGEVIDVDVSAQVE
jgi:phage terminase small subunit